MQGPPLAPPTLISIQKVDMCYSKANRHMYSHTCTHNILSRAGCRAVMSTVDPENTASNGSPFEGIEVSSP